VLSTVVFGQSVVRAIWRSDAKGDISSAWEIWSSVKFVPGSPDPSFEPTLFASKLALRRYFVTEECAIVSDSMKSTSSLWTVVTDSPCIPRNKQTDLWSIWLKIWAPRAGKFVMDYSATKSPIARSSPKRMLSFDLISCFVCCWMCGMEWIQAHVQLLQLSRDTL
jgi:hypothetical protein